MITPVLIVGGIVFGFVATNRVIIAIQAYELRKLRRWAKGQDGWLAFDGLRFRYMFRYNGQPITAVGLTERQALHVAFDAWLRLREWEEM